MAEDREQLLQHYRQSLADLLAAVDGLDDQDLTEPSLDGWSIKDHLAHLTAWRRMVLGLLDGEPRHVALQVDEATYAQGEDAINAALAARARSRPLSDVLSQFRQVYDTLIARLAAFDETTWHEPYPLTPRPKDGRLGNIEGNTFEHDLEHLGYIEQLLQKDQDGWVTVVLPEILPARWWQNILHNQRALMLKAALLFKERVILTDVPYHLQR